MESRAGSVQRLVDLGGSPLAVMVTLVEQELYEHRPMYRTSQVTVPTNLYFPPIS